MAKFSKDLLKKAKKAAQEAGTNVTSNSREKRNEKKSVARVVRDTLRESKSKSGAIKWNLDIGDLVDITSASSPANIGYVSKIETGSALSVKDYGQYVAVITATGLIHIHPKNAKVIQKA
jgi:hypothetical protein